MIDIGFLFSCDYFNHSEPDADYADEFNTARSRVFPVFLFNAETLFENNKLNFKEIPSKYEKINAGNEQKKPETLIYRGWMLSAEQYTLLYLELRKIGYKLINTPEQYISCHHLPKWYDEVKEDTALSVWTNKLDVDSIKEKLSAFASDSLIVKDYVKSRKHEWAEACFIPDASDTDSALKVIDTFIRRQGADLAGGVVLREFLKLKMIGTHPKSNMPIANEVRIFVLLHSPLVEIDYWSGKNLLDIDNEYQSLVNKYAAGFSNFFTIDLAQKEDGKWAIIEIGDGQVSGLQGLSATKFYHAFAKKRYDPDMKNAVESDKYIEWRKKQEALIFQEKKKGETESKIIFDDLTSETTFYSHKPEEGAEFYVDGFERHLFKKDKLVYTYRSINGSRNLCKVIHHQDGKKYLIFKRDLYGHSVLDLDNLRDYHYMPAASLKGEETFIWCNVFYNPFNNILAVDGCLWAGPYDFLLFDFSNPLASDEFQLMLNDKDINLDFPKVDAKGFDPWSGTDLVVPIDKNDNIDDDELEENYQPDILTIKQDTYLRWLNERRNYKLSQI